MENKDTISRLQTAGLVIMIRDDQLVIKHDPKNKITEKVMTLLTDDRAEIKAILQASELKKKRPYIDGNYHRGKGKKGCLVIPTNCAPRYKYWLPPFECIVVEGEDWYEKRHNKEEKDQKWKPLSLLQIMQELEAPEDLVDLYCKKKTIENNE